MFDTDEVDGQTTRPLERLEGRSPFASGMALARMMAALALQILMIRTGEGSRAASRDRSSSSEVATIAPNAWAIRTT